MDHDTWIDSWQVLMAPSKGVQVVFQEDYELLTDRRVRLGADVSDSI